MAMFTRAAPHDEAVATASEAESDAGFDGVVHAAPGGGRRLAAGAALVGLLGGSALVAGRASRGQTLGKDVVSLASAANDTTTTTTAAPWSTKRRTGCSNWKQIYMASGVYDDESQCGAVCSYTPGCIGFNYQPFECSNIKPNTGTDKHTCYLQAAECEEESNTCWDLHVVDDPRPPDFCLTRTRTGCSNWNDIVIHKSQVAHEAMCHMRCREHKENCTAFNFQPQGGKTCKQSHGFEPGTCLIFNGKCEIMDNNCWDLYAPGSCPTVSETV